MLSKSYDFLISLGQRMPRKFRKQFDQDFKFQLQYLQQAERQQLIQNAMREARNQLNQSQIDKAQQSLAFAIVTAVNNKIPFPEHEYDLDSMIRKCWLFSRFNSSREIDKNRQLMRKAGFQVKENEKYERIKSGITAPKQKKGGGWFACFSCFS